MGGVYIAMSHLGPEKVEKSFPGMVKRCRDCGFDLAGGRVEVVPTAHYMMGGVEFEADTSTAIPGLFAAGEDCGGVHGANRLGGTGWPIQQSLAVLQVTAWLNLSAAWRSTAMLMKQPLMKRLPRPVSVYETAWRSGRIARSAG